MNDTFGILSPKYMCVTIKPFLAHGSQLLDREAYDYYATLIFGSIGS